MADYDVGVIGGGVSGPAVALFAARAGLDTVVFDRGPSSIARCAHLENFLGFPAGIDPGRFRDLVHDQLRRAGCEIREEEVTRVEDGDGTASFRIQTGKEVVESRRVVAATKYTAAYLDPLFGNYLEDRGENRVLDPDVVDADGRTPVEGLYVAGPLAGEIDQAMTSAGHGTRVARAVIADEREDRGYWPEMAAAYYDWATPGTDHDDLESNVREWVESTIPDGVTVEAERVERVIEETIEHERASALGEGEIEERRRRGQEAILDHLDDEVVQAYVDREVSGEDQ